MDNTGSGVSTLNWKSILTSIQNIPTAIYYIGKIVGEIFPQTTNATATSATSGSASTLPGTPAGYLVVTLPDGTVAKFPYYNN